MHLLANQSLHKVGTDLRRVLDLLSENVLEGDGISRKFRDTFPKLVDSHGILVEVEAEQRFVFEVGLLRDLQGLRTLSIELLGYFFRRVVKFLEKGGLFNVSLNEHPERPVRYIPQLSSNRSQPAR